MGRISQYMIHCTDTPPHLRVNKRLLRRWHMAPRREKDGTFVYKGKRYEKLKYANLEDLHRRVEGRGWDRLGYHKLIHRDGTVEVITKIGDDNYLGNDEMTWGCAGQNDNAYHVALVGGRTKENKSPKKDAKFLDIFTYQQFIAIQDDIKSFLGKHEHVKVSGHYFFDKRKRCPNFDVRELAELLDLNEFLL